jgi:hypothetical protein
VPSWLPRLEHGHVNSAMGIRGDSREAAHLTLLPAGIKRHYNSCAAGRATVANRLHPRHVLVLVTSCRDRTAECPDA